jgi:hypothetical protein
MITNSATIKAKAYKAGWYGSDVVNYTFYKNTYKPDSIQLITIPNEKYRADGAKTLTDGDLGGTNADNSKWLGLQTDLGVMMYFNKPVKLHSLTLNCLKAIGGQIFLPDEMQVWGGTDKTHLKLMGTVKTGEQKKNDPVIVEGITCALSASAPVSCIKLVAKPIYKLPAWHYGKGKPSWIFTDEVFLN